MGIEGECCLYLFVSIGLEYEPSCSLKRGVDGRFDLVQL